MARKQNPTVKELLEKDFAELDSLARDMGRMAKTVENFPETIEYSQDNLQTLEEARHQALKLARECEVAIQVFEKGK